VQVQGPKREKHVMFLERMDLKSTKNDYGLD